MTTTTNLIKEKKARLEILEGLFQTLEREEKYHKEKTIWFDTDKPILDDDGNPKTRDDGSIRYKQSYHTETIPDEELSENDKIYITAIQTIKNQLEKMI